MTEDELKQHISTKLKYYREKANLTQLQTAKKVGTGSTHISYIENAYGLPSLYTLQKLCLAYGIKSSDILPF